MPTPVALITGASRGIGLATAIALSNLNYRLALVARSAEALAETARLLARPANEILPIPADISDPAACAKAIDQTLHHFGQLDSLIHAAGIARAQSIAQTTLDQWHQAIDTNLSSAFYLAKYSWPHLKRPMRALDDIHLGNMKHEDMKHQAEPLSAIPQSAIGNPQSPSSTQHSAPSTQHFPLPAPSTIILISSLASRDPFPGLGAYAAAKAGLNLLGLAAAREGQADCINVHIIAPGAVETQMLRALLTPEQLPASKTMPPEEVAQVIVDCVTGRLRHASGEVIYLHRSL